MRKACGRVIKIRNMNQSSNQTYLDEAKTRIEKLVLNLDPQSLPRSQSLQ